MHGDDAGIPGTEWKPFQKPFILSSILPKISLASFETVV